MRTAVLGASGYAGAELLRLIANHPDLDLELATGESAAGTMVRTHSPSLAGAYPSLVFSPTSAVDEADVDVVFLALPHGVSQDLVPRLLERNLVVVDLGADFRLPDAATYEQWYGHAHRAPDSLGRAIYGLVERYRDEIRDARFLAIPGCYPTATTLALAPFVDAGVIAREGIIVNALSGVSGAGRASSDRLHFPRVAGGAEAYGLLTHRHTAEMQMELGASVLFTPHLIPIARGMLVTAYAPLARDCSTDHALALLSETYASDPFISVSATPPSAKDPLGSNMAMLSVVVDERTRTLVAMAAIDNLTKGAAGQALQAFNVAMGLDETRGLSLAAVAP